MLKNDTLKNGMSRIGLYGSAPPSGFGPISFKLEFKRYHVEAENVSKLAKNFKGG